MIKASRRLLAWGAVLCASTCLTTPALAQSLLPGAPPVRLNADGNGVDVVSGAFNLSVAEVSIGKVGAGGMVYARDFRGSGWRDNLVGTLNASGTTYTVSIGGASETFTLSGTAFISDQGMGSTLKFDSVHTYTYTRSDGVMATFSDTLITANLQANKGLITSLVRPTGETNTYYYDTITVDVVGSCTGCVTFGRVRAVTNNFGYQIRLGYASNTATTTANIGPWLDRTTATGFNQVIDNCLPTATSCSFSRTWPNASYVNGTTSTVTDALSRVTTYTYNGSAQITRIHRPSSSSGDDLVIGYTSGRVSSVTNGTGSWAYTYTDVGTTRTTVTTDPNSYTRTTVSDLTLGQVTSDRKGSPDTTTYGYDTQGRLTRITLPEGDATHGYTEYTYDSRGNATQTKVVPKAGSGLSNIITTADFDSTCTPPTGNPVKCNKPNSITDANGYRTDFTYDATHGGIVSILRPAPSGATPVGSGTRPETRFSYTQLSARNSSGSAVFGPAIYLQTGMSTCATGTVASGCVGTADESKTTTVYGSPSAANNLLPTSVTSASGNSSGPGAVSATTTSTYDDIGNLASVNGPLGGSADSFNYRYDDDRQLTGAIGPDPDGSATHNLFRAVTVDYDPDGRPTAIKQGTATSATGWSSFATLQELDITYDGIGRKVKDTIKVGGTTQAITQYSYDDANRAVCTAQRLTLTGIPSDACASDTGLLDRITKFQYNAADQVTKVKTGLNTAVQRDAATYTYTDDGLVATITEPVIGTVAGAQPSLTTFEYDGVDRLSKVRYPKPNLTGSGAGTSSTTDYELYTYDPASRITDDRRRDNTHIVLGYDNLGRVSTKDVPGTTNDVAYGYDLLDRMTSAATSGQTLSFGYDALGRNTSQGTTLGGATVYTVDYDYDAAGQRTQMTWPDAVYVTYDYDNSGSVTAIRESGALSGVRVLAQYVYDDLGRRTELDRGNGVASTFSFTGAWLTGLTQAVDSPNAQTLTFTNNAAGQILTRASNNDTYAWGGAYDVDRTYTPNGLNQLTTSGALSLSYDSLGNLTSDGADTFTYDNQNRLTGVTGSATLSYDPLGRLTKTTGSATTQYLYDGADLIAEYNSSASTVLRRYVHGPGADEPLVWYEGSGVTDRRWMIADQEGTITAVTDSTGAATGLNTYDDYGEPGAANTGRFQYTGQVWLPDVGLYHYKARAYSPTLGRFMQTDPAGYVDSLNLYAYVGNDPLNGTDPSGLATVVPITFPCGSLPTYDYYDEQGNKGVGGGVQLCTIYIDIATGQTSGTPGGTAGTTRGGSQAGSQTTTCQGMATFSAVGPLPQAPGDSAFAPGTKPANGTVAVAGASTFGFSRRALRNGAAGAIQINPSGLGDLLRATGGPQPPYSVGDFGDVNIRNAPGTRFDIYRFDTLKGARVFGKRTVFTTVTVPPGGHCPPGFK